MENSKLSHKLQIALQHHQAGNLSQAESIYRYILQKDPKHYHALHLLGVIAIQTQNYAAAIPLIQKAIQLNNRIPDFYSNLGLALNEQHQSSQAEQACRQALILKPHYPEALNNLGIALKEQKRWEEAATCYHRALVLNPQYVEAYYNLGVALKEQGQWREAIACYRKALDLNPNYYHAYNHLGLVLNEQGQWQEAVKAFEHAIHLAPTQAEAYNNLGNLWRDQGRDDDAIVYYQKALQLKPNDVRILNNLGVTWCRKLEFTQAETYLIQALKLDEQCGETMLQLGIVYRKQDAFDKALSYFQRAIELQCDPVEVYVQMGSVLRAQGHLETAFSTYKQGLERHPNAVEILNNMGNLLREQGQLTSAIECYQQVVKLRPLLSEPYNNLSIALNDQGKIEEAISCCRQSLACAQNPVTYSNLLFISHYLTDDTLGTSLRTAQLFNKQLVKPLIFERKQYKNSPIPTRRLRIGYVSPDFYRHSVGYFMVAILTHHSPDEFEIFCYYTGNPVDDLTHQFQHYSNYWIQCGELSDSRLADKIHHDQIDILVDLAGHTAGNRLMVFARKPAPIQMSYLGYPDTTGVETIDYRIVDNYVEPCSNANQVSTETLLKMPHSYFCYTPTESELSVNTLPVLKNNYITFCSFNNLCKLNDNVLQLWAQVLLAVPNSKLFLKTKSFSDIDTRQRLQNRFIGWGISPDRLILMEKTPDLQTHLQQYQQADIGLDTFPYNGATTTCEALWMGVPVVTLVGQTHIARVGLSLLSTVGLQSFITYSPEEYVATCVKLSQDIPALATLRANLRNRLKNSPLLDGAMFTRQLENHYRTVWQQWCHHTEKY